MAHLCFVTMANSFQSEPETRPTFAQISKDLESLKFGEMEDDYSSFSVSYNNSATSTSEHVSELGVNAPPATTSTAFVMVQCQDSSALWEWNPRYLTTTQLHKLYTTNQLLPTLHNQLQPTYTTNYTTNHTTNYNQLLINGVFLVLWRPLAPRVASCALLQFTQQHNTTNKHYIC